MMKRLNPTKTILLVILAVALTLLAIGWQQAGARNATLDKNVSPAVELRCNADKCAAFTYPYGDAQELLGMSRGEFFTSCFQNKESLANLATEAGVDAEKIVDLFAASEIVWIDQMVIEGFYTISEAEEAKKNAIGNASMHIFSPYQDPFYTAAEAIGVDYDVLLNLVDEGSVPADFAKPNRIEAEEIYEAVLRADLNHIHAQVKYGLINESSAELKRAEAPERAYDVVYKKWYNRRLTSNFFFDFRSLFTGRQRSLITQQEDIQPLGSAKTNAQLDLESVITISARALDMSDEALQADLNTEMKIAEVAIKNNVPPQKVIDELALAQTEIIDQLIANGTFREADKEALLIDQNFTIREIVYAVDLSK